MDKTAVRLRHELKYSIDRGACALLRERLGAVMRPDAHAGAGGYEVRSLYFDDMYGSAYGDKSAGLLRREKFRLRIYDGDDGCIKLERKAKVGALCHKESERLSRASYDALLAGELPAPDTSGLRGALRPELDVNDIAEDLRMLAKQNASLSEMESVLAESVTVLPTREMRDAVRRLYEGTPRWLGLKAALEH